MQSILSTSISLKYKPGERKHGQWAACGPRISRNLKGKRRVVPVLLTEHHAMKAYWVVEV